MDVLAKFRGVILRRANDRLITVSELRIWNELPEDVAVLAVTTSAEDIPVPLPEIVS